MLSGPLPEPVRDPVLAKNHLAQDRQDPFSIVGRELQGEAGVPLKLGPHDPDADRLLMMREAGLWALAQRGLFNIRGPSHR